MMNYEFKTLSIERKTLKIKQAELIKKIRSIANKRTGRCLVKLNAAIAALDGINAENFEPMHEIIMRSLESMRMSLEEIVAEIGYRANTKLYLGVVIGMIVGMGGSDKSHLRILSGELKEHLTTMSMIYTSCELRQSVPESAMRFVSLGEIERKLEGRNLNNQEIEDLHRNLLYFHKLLN